VAYQADIRISVKGAKQLDALSKAADKLVPQINAANAAFIRLGEIQQKNLPLVVNFTRVLRENQKAFASTILSNKEATDAAKGQAKAEKELNNELARRNAVLNKARGIKSDPVAKSIARNRGKLSDANALAFENVRDLPGGSKRPSRFAQFSQDVTKTSVEKKIQADLENEKRLAKDIADIRSRSASRIETHNKRRISREKEIEKILKDAEKVSKQRSKILQRDAKVIKQEISQSAGGRFRRFQRNRTSEDKRIRRDTLSSAAIGGAFPLLFGQGPLAAAGGAAGGFAGGILGGQAGFALSLVGTQIGSAISQLVAGAGELGQAIGSFAQDTQAVTTAIGLQNSAEQARLNLIEEVEGKTAAFNASMKLLRQEVGERGVKALQRFGENQRIINRTFATLGTNLQSLAARIVNFVLEITGIEKELNLAEAQRIVQNQAILTGDPKAKQLAKDIQETKRVPREGSLATGQIVGLIPNTNKARLAEKAKETDEAVLQFAQETKINNQLDLRFKKLTSIAQSKKDELDLNQRVNKLSEKHNKQLATEIAKINQKFDKQKQILQGEIGELQFKFMKGELDKNEITFLDQKIKKLQDLGILQEDVVDDTITLGNATDKVAEAFQRLNETIRNDIKEGIKGLIKGTSTLGDLLNNVADRFLDLALNQALFGSAAGEFTKGKGGGIFGAIAGMFANGGRPPVGRPSIVGEKGPELFVPRTSGTIVPNNKLGGGGSTSVVVNVDASGSDVQGDDAGAKELGTLISVAVQGELLKQQRPGGLLSSLR
jgi:hypothetical protein